MSRKKRLRLRGSVKREKRFELYLVLYHKKAWIKASSAFFDNGFTAHEARENVNNLCAKLNVDLVIGRPTKFRRKQIKKALLMAKRSGKYVKVCGNCENNMRTFTINESKKRNIPSIILGSTKYENKPEEYLKDKVELSSRGYGTYSSMFNKITRALKLLLQGNGTIN